VGRFELIWPRYAAPGGRVAQQGLVGPLPSPDLPEDGGCGRPIACMTPADTVPDHPRRAHPVRSASSCSLALVLLLGLPSLRPAPARAASGGNDEIADLLPSDACIRRARSARIVAMGGALDEARQMFRSALDDCPRDAVILHDLFELYARSAGHEAEAATLRAELRALLEDPAIEIPESVLRLLGRLTPANAEDQEGLLSSFRRRLSARPDDPQLLETVLTYETQLGHLEAAREHLASLLRLDPKERWSWAAFLIDLELEHWQDALSFTRQSLSGGDASALIASSHLQLLAKLGRAQEIQQLLFGEGEEADAFYSRIGEVPASGLRAIAWDLYDAGSDRDAEELWRRIYELHPDDDEAWRVLYYLFSDPNERRGLEAARQARPAEEMEPADLLDEGAELLAGGDAEGALPLLQRAAELLPATEAAWYNLGLAAFQLERWPEAADAFLRALVLNSERAESHYYAALALGSAGRCAEAVPQFEAALELAPRRELYYYLSTCLSELGQAAEAHGAMQRYRELRNEPD
jgi:tetratricopeptide (TPR) repeat protein